MKDVIKMNIEIPLITLLSRKYFGYADDSSEKIHHRALDVRHCNQATKRTTTFKNARYGS